MLASVMGDFVISILVSACLGALVGLVRQWSDQKAPEGEIDFGGVRTYTLWAILGCVAAFLTGQHATALLAVVVALVGLHVTALHFAGNHGGRPGSTTFAASLLTCLIGALVQWQHLQAAVVVAAITAVMIGIKQPLHAWTRAFTGEDTRAALQFIAITGVVLPLVPNRDFGPFSAFNPHSIWLMVVLISGLGFAGYIMMRLLGAKAGIPITGLVGGVASSTATTLAFSRRSREETNLSGHYAFAVVVASTVMLARVLVVVGVINRELALSLLLPFGVLAVPGIAYAVWVWFFRRPADESVETPHLHNPLSLGTAIKFGVIYAVVAFLVKAATHYNLRGSLLPLGFISGLTDMDAISLLMAHSRNSNSVEGVLAAQTVILAVLGNTVTKGGIALMLGAPALRRQVSLILGLTLLAGAGSLWLVR